MMAVPLNFDHLSDSDLLEAARQHLCLAQQAIDAYATRRDLTCAPEAGRTCDHEAAAGPKGPIDHEPTP